MRPARPLPRLPYVLLARDVARLLRRAVPHRRRPLGGRKLALAPRPADRVGRLSAWSLLPVLILFVACVSIRRWYRPDRPSADPMPSSGTDVVTRDVNIH